MGNIDNRIEALHIESFAIKLEVNSNFSNMSTSKFHELVERRSEIKQEIRQLTIVKDRKLKINQIISRL